MGKRKISWQLATAEGLAERIADEGTQGMRTQLAHYRESGCQAMLDKILLAKKLSELILLERRVEEKKLEIQAL